MPFRSKAQQGYLEAHPEKIGGRAKLKEWEQSTDYSHLPKHVKKTPRKGGNTTLAMNSMKYRALHGRETNLKNKQAFADGSCNAARE